MNILIYIFFSSLAFSTTLTIKDLVQNALVYSPGIKGELMALNASEASLKQSRTLSNPFFTFQGGTLRSGSQSGSVTDFTLNQPLPWPGKRSTKIEASQFMKSLAELSKEERILEISHRVFISGVEVAALEELQSHYSERKRRFSLIEKSLRSRPQASPKQKVDRDLIESQMNIMEKEMIDIIARKEALLWELRIFTNSEVEKIIFKWDSFPELSREKFLKDLESSPRIKRLGIENKLARNKIEQARLEARPDIMVGVNYRKENVAPVNHFYHGQISVVIPIVDNGQHSVNAAKAEERMQSAFHQLERDEMIAYLHQLFSQYEASKKAIEVFKLKNLQNMETKFYEAEVSFRKGFIDALTFLQIDSQVHENIGYIYMTRLSYITALSNLNLLVGKSPEI
jgi:outer membrane protein TolC